MVKTMEVFLRRWATLGALFFCVAGCTDAPLPEPSDATARTLAQGEVIGYLADNSTQIWMGIPYGASTEGHNRWRAPQPAPGWEGIRHAIAPAERCAQLTNEFDSDEGLEPGLAIGSEDCLTLDIYSPPGTSHGELPVLVWIHGGGNVWGRSSTYNGSNLAANENVVIVAVQYRLGPLGWFAHPLVRSSATHPHDMAASFTTLDLIESLRWVRTNIEAFGGNPDNVTIAGESHGGYNVMTLLASPLAAGLFHRAIIQSGGFDSMSIDEAEGNTGKRINTSREIVDRLNIKTADELRALPVDELLQAYTRGTGFLDVPRVIEDGVVLPAHRLRQSFASKNSFNAVPILMGTNLNEMKLFYVGDERFIEASMGIFPVVQDLEFWDLFTGYLTRLWRIRSIDEQAAMMRHAGHENVYAYRFDWDDGGKFLAIDMKRLFGAAHAFEVPFVFNRFEHLGGSADDILFEPETQAEREDLSRAMGGFWISFARDGVPHVDGLPEWPVYAAAEGTFLRFDSSNDNGIEVVNSGIDRVEHLIDDLNSDPRLTAETRCLVVNEMQRWMYSIDIEHLLQQGTNCIGEAHYRNP